MTRQNFENEVEKLKSEIELRDIEIKRCLAKIETLEDTILDMEFNLSKNSDQNDYILLKNKVKHLENYNRELKDKMGFLRLENIKLKMKLEEKNKEFYDNLSLINVIENDFHTKKANQGGYSKVKIKNTGTTRELFKILELKCPICETHKKIKIPLNIINPSSKMITINIPEKSICDHSFQILIDQSFKVKKYQIGNFESNLIEYADSKYFPIEIISQIRTFIDDIDVLGLVIFDDEWNVQFASMPSEFVFDLFKEINLRKKQKDRRITKLYMELKNENKMFIENIDILNYDYNLILLFSPKINFGMGTMLLKDIREKLEKSITNYREDIT